MCNGLFCLGALATIASIGMVLVCIIGESFMWW